MRDAELRSVPRLDRPTSIRGVGSNLAEGLRYVRHTPVVLLAVRIVGLVATFGMNFNVLVPPLADNILLVGAIGYGFLMAASGLGSTVVGPVGRVQPAPVAEGDDRRGDGAGCRLAAPRRLAGSSRSRWWRW